MDPKQPPRTGGPETRVIRLDALLQRRAHPVALTLTPADHKALAAELDLLGLEKARLTGELRPVGKRDWDFVGTLGATVTQACVVTLAPVRTRIDEPVLRRFRADLSDDVVGDEIEMPEDDSLEPLPETVDLLDLFAESLALSLPDNEYKPLILTATYAVVLFSIIVQGLTVTRVINRTVDPTLL